MDPEMLVVMTEEGREHVVVMVTVKGKYAKKK